MIRRAVAIILALSVLLASPVMAAPDPVACTGYPEPRVFLEAQDWWTPIPTLGGTGHVHMGMCFPLGKTVGGQVRFDVRVMLHENKGKWFRLKGQDDKSVNFHLSNPNITPPAGGLHTYWTAVTVDTTKMNDGLRQFRWYADLLHANGNTQTARTSWPLDIENGKTDVNVTGGAALTRFLNWYKVKSPARDWGYAGPIISPVPLGTVKGSVTFKIDCKVNGNGSPPISRRIVNIDPNFHAGLSGTVVHDSATTSGNITINTTNFSNGEHKLVARCVQVSGSERHEGIGVIPFKVANP